MQHMINAKYFSTLPEIKRIRITNINGKNKKIIIIFTKLT